MKSESEKLSCLLKEWQPELPCLEGVRREVWRRVESRDSVGMGGLLAAFEEVLGRPLVATGIVVLAVVGGLLLGVMASESAQQAAYLRAVSAHMHAR